MIKAPTLNISLTPSLRKYIQSQVASGRYESASEVIRESLRTLERQEKEEATHWADVRRKVAEAKDAVLCGDVADGSQFMNTIKQKLLSTKAKPRKRQ